MSRRLKLKTPNSLVLSLGQIDEQGFHNWLKARMIAAYAEARRGKRTTHDEHEFELNWAENIDNLVKMIEERHYVPGASIAFVIYDPMVREIFAAMFKDRSVHHLLHSTTSEYYEEDVFIDTSTSCRKGKGTKYAIEVAQEHMRLVTENFTKKAWVVKLDLSGYFMSLPRVDLCNIIIDGLNRQFKPYRGRRSAEQLLATLKFLWERVIMDDPAEKARKRGSESDWDPEVLPPRKSLFCQPVGQGIVIGNLTSQLASNIYLHALDIFVTEVLGYRYYGRYVDDFYIMVSEEDYPQLKRDIKVIEQFLKNELGLTLHPNKRYCQSVYKGLPYLGARIYPHCLYPSDRLQAKFKKAVYDFEHGQGKIETVISYLGHMKHLDADRFIKKVFQEVGWDFEVYLETKLKHHRPVRDLVLEMSNKE